MVVSSVEDGRVAEGAVEPAVGDLLVGGLGEVDAVPAEVRRRAGAGGGARHPAPRAVGVVVLASPRPAARREHRAEPCTIFLTNLVMSEREVTSCYLLHDDDEDS